VNPCAKDNLISLLRETQAILRRPQNDFAWSHWDNAEQAISDIESHIAAIQREDASRLEDLRLLFAATGSIQEVSESSGWGREFIDLAARFDKTLQKACPDAPFLRRSKKRWWRSWWFLIPLGVLGGLAVHYSRLGSVVPR
jgi:hypothetical protein